jgi:hypothetical protein
LVLITWLLLSSTSSVTRDVVALTIAGALLYAAMRWLHREPADPTRIDTQDE